MFLFLIFALKSTDCIHHTTILHHYGSMLALFLAAATETHTHKQSDSCGIFFISVLAYSS